jgi:hypothetical protein
MELYSKLSVWDHQTLICECTGSSGPDELKSQLQPLWYVTLLAGTFSSLKILHSTFTILIFADSKFHGHLIAIYILLVS